MKIPSLMRSAMTALALGAMTSLACAQDMMPMNGDSAMMPMKNAAPTPPSANAAMQRVLDQFKSYDSPPPHRLTPQNARNAPSIQLAAMEVLSKEGRPSFAPIGDIFHRAIPGPKGTQIYVRFYKPTSYDPTDAGNEPLPLIVYFHGGGFVFATLDTYDASCRALANGANAIVASVAYPLAPEMPFPAAPEAAYAATQYLTLNAAEYGADRKRVAVAGESAGGNLATVVCMMAKARKGMMPVHQLLVYPFVLNSAKLSDAELFRRFPSYAVNANAMPLGKDTAQWFWPKYKGRSNPLAEPIVADADDLRGLPPATIIAAEIDPLLSEGQQYRDKLQQAGVTVQYQLYNGVTHEFFGMGMIVPEAKQAEDFASQQLQTAFAR